MICAQWSALDACLHVAQKRTPSDPALFSLLLVFNGFLASLLLGFQEFFKMAPDVVERRTKGLEVYMTTIIRRFPDILESSHLDRYDTTRRNGMGWGWGGGGEGGWRGGVRVGWGGRGGVFRFCNRAALVCAGSARPGRSRFLVFAVWSVDLLHVIRGWPDCERCPVQRRRT